jgi:cytochrome c oxidase subunit 1
MTFLIGVPTGVKFFNWIGTMWRGKVHMDTPMIWSIGFLITFLFGGLTGIILASPPLDFAVSASYFVVAHFHYVIFWTVLIGFHMTFLIQHWLGIVGMPRRYADYLASDGFTGMNMISTVGAFLLAFSTIPFLLNIWITRNSPKVTSDDPWGYGGSLEWATSCPPPRHNFTSIPRIRSERPAFDLHHPEVADKR